MTDRDIIEQDQESGKIAAMRLSFLLGQQLQNEHPEIADMYRAGKRHAEIDEDLDVSSRYGVTSVVARIAIGNAIKGSMGVVGLEGYVGLITDVVELEEIRKQHQIEGSHKSYRDGTGIHAMTFSERQAAGRVGGSIGGSKSVEKKLGIHAMTDEQRKAAGHKGGSISGKRNYQLKKGVHGRTKKEMSEHTKIGLRNQGYVPFIEREETDVFTRLGELEYAFMLTKSPEYQRKSRINAKKIAAELNKVYHGSEEVRTNRSVISAISKYRASLKQSG